MGGGSKLTMTGRRGRSSTSIILVKKGEREGGREGGCG